MALTDNLISYWKLDESSGNALDAHGSNDGTLVNTPTQGATGKINTCYDFESGSSEYIDIANTITLTTAASWQIWVKLESLPTYYVFIGNRDGGNNWQLYGDNAGHIGLLMWGVTPVTADVAASMPTGEWVHLVMTYDGSSTIIYMNNSVVYDEPATGTIASNTGDTKIGSDAPAGSNEIDGLVDEVAIWSRALTPTEVAELYNSGNGFAYPFSAGTNMQVNIDDTMKDVAAAYVNVDDAWKEVASAVVNVDDAWKTIF